MLPESFSYRFYQPIKVKVPVWLEPAEVPISHAQLLTYPGGSVLPPTPLRVCRHLLHEFIQNADLFLSKVLLPRRSKPFSIVLRMWLEHSSGL